MNTLRFRVHCLVLTLAAAGLSVSGQEVPTVPKAEKVQETGEVQKAGQTAREPKAAEANHAPRPGSLVPMADPDIIGLRGSVIVNGDSSFPFAGLILKNSTNYPWTHVRIGHPDGGFKVLNSDVSNTLFSIPNSGNVEIRGGGNKPLSVGTVTSPGVFTIEQGTTLGVDVAVKISGTNNALYAGGVEVGKGGSTVINSIVDNTPLYLNRFVTTDVAIGSPTSAGALKVLGTGDSTFAGKVKVGTSTVPAALEVTGDVSVGGTLSGNVVKATFQDVAEWVPVSEDLVPGTVVVVDPVKGNLVIRSTRAYDTTVAGVVSLQPGIVLGVEGASKEAVATTGRVRVKVDASSGAIAIGDLLVTSDKPGLAMRSKPIDVGGVAIHRPGTIIGKALERLERGEGEILVLLSLQ
jgi:hypothetical protein